MTTDSPEWLHFLLNRQVVAEIGDGFTAFGTLEYVGPAHLFMRDVDLHQQAEANSSRDVYAIEAQAIGIRPNRKTMAIPLNRLIAICPLEDVIP
ncbi:MAG: hypothetical protein PF961_23750 [Planctomycetota bacterium]|jgi:hypothetical protein|nr:hypothetical protein [Planctomycetota bacterium]